MGCAGSTAAKNKPRKPQSNSKKNSGHAEDLSVQPKEENPDRGLNGSHEVIKFLGRGGTGDTWLYRDKLTGEEVAIKLVKRPVPKVLQPNLLREIRIQADLGEGHVNVIQAKEALLTDKHLALVLEYAACGSLTKYVTDKWQNAQATGLFCSEDEARYFFRQFVNAVDYCHQHFVAHRDLKLDNTLLDRGELGESMPPVIKLCDFGFAKDWEIDEEANMYTHIGTPVYMAPELIHSRYGSSGGYDGKLVDVWASGILLIVMLVGQFPYDHIMNPDPNTSEAHQEVWEQQTKTSWEDIPRLKPNLKVLSDECKDLLNRIFQTDETARITVAQIREHPWFLRPLSPDYQRAQDMIDALQAEHDLYIQNRRISPVLLKRRNKELQNLLDEAAHRISSSVTKTDKPRIRINLRESEILENPTAYGENAELGDVILEDDEGELRAQQSNLRALVGRMSNFDLTKDYHD